MDGDDLTLWRLRFGATPALIEALLQDLQQVESAESHTALDELFAFGDFTMLLRNDYRVSLVPKKHDK